VGSFERIGVTRPTACRTNNDDGYEVPVRLPGKGVLVEGGPEQRNSGFRRGPLCANSARLAPDGRRRAVRRRRIGIYGASDESLRLVELLTSNPDVEIARVYHPVRGEALAIARAVDPALPSELDALLGDDADAFAADASLDAVIDGLGEPHFAAHHPAATARGLQIVSPLTARLLWGYGVPSRDRKAELLQALSEVVMSATICPTSHCRPLCRSSR